MKHKGISFHRAHTQEKLQPLLDDGWVPVTMCSDNGYVTVILKESLSDEQREAKIKQIFGEVFRNDDEVMSDENVIKAINAFATYILSTDMGERVTSEEWFKNNYRS